MARRGRSEGSIWQRSKDCWVAILNVGKDASGRRKRIYFYGRTKREAQEKLIQAQSDNLAGLAIAPQRLTVAAFLNRWLEDAARPTIRPHTYTRYEGIVRLWVIPQVGGIQLSKLGALHVQGMLAAQKRAGASPRTCELSYAVLRRALSQAVKWKMLPSNACEAIDKPRVPKRSMQVWTPEQVTRFLAVARDDRLGALYLLALTTGMRQGELFGLRWQDVDLNRRSISVQHTLSELKGKRELAETKTAKGRRRVDLPGVAVRALVEHRARMAAEGHGEVEWVFCDTGGGPLQRANVIQRSFEPLMAKAGLPAIRFHDLRHTAATLLLAQGIHAKVVQERLGHSQISVTLDTYSHVLPSMQREAADKLDDLLSEGA